MSLWIRLCNHTYIHTYTSTASSTASLRAVLSCGGGHRPPWAGSALLLAAEITPRKHLLLGAQTPCARQPPFRGVTTPPTCVGVVRSSVCARAHRSAPAPA